MRFGKIQDIAVELDPVVPTWERRTPSDQGPWARLVIWVAGRNLCRHWTPGSGRVDEGVYVPLAPIADWLCRNISSIAQEESAHAFPTDVRLHNEIDKWRHAAPAEGYDEDRWDDLRWEWSQRHFLSAGSDGAFLPNLALARADGDLWLSWAPADFATPDAPELLEREGLTRVSWTEAGRVLGEFVAEVARSLRESGLTSPYPWSREEDPLRLALVDDLASFARFGLGLETAELTELFEARSEAELLVELALERGESPGHSAVLQALRDLEPEGAVARALLEDDRATQREASGAFAQARAAMVDPRGSMSLEEQGYQVARDLRQKLGLDGEPLGDLGSRLTGPLGIQLVVWDDVRSTRDHMIAPGHLAGSGQVTLFDSPATRAPWSKTMEMLRGVGHLLTDGGPGRQAIGAGSSSRAVGPRRRRSGAFAAEMALPAEVIRRRTGGVLDRIAQPTLFTSLMSDYGVGARTAVWQAWNAGLLSSREVVEEPIQTHGAPEAG